MEEEEMEKEQEENRWSRDGGDDAGAHLPLALLARCPRIKQRVGGESAAAAAAAVRCPKTGVVIS